MHWFPHTIIIMCWNNVLDVLTLFVTRSFAVGQCGGIVLPCISLLIRFLLMTSLLDLMVMQMIARCLQIDWLVEQAHKPQSYLICLPLSICRHCTLSQSVYMLARNRFTDGNKWDVAVCVWFTFSWFSAMVAIFSESVLKGCAMLWRCDVEV